MNEYRQFTVDKIKALGLNDLIARDVDIGIYNWSLDYATENKMIKSWMNPRFLAVYREKARSICDNLNPTSYVKNVHLLDRMKNKEFLPHDLSIMTKDRVHPEMWRNIIDTQVRKDLHIYDQKVEAMTDQYLCMRCKGRKVVYREIQLRSADEPMSIFFSCISCGNRWTI